MENKTAYYRLTETKCIKVSVASKDEEETIKDLNREFAARKMRDKRYGERCISLDGLREKGYDIPDGTHDPLNETIRKETVLAVRKAIKTLTSRQRAIVIKVFFEGKKQSEAAEELGVSKSCVSLTMQRALSKMRKYLEEKGIKK